MKAALIQQAAADVTDYLKVKDEIIGLIDRAGNNGAKLIVLPECSYPAYYLGFDVKKNNESLKYTQQVLDLISERCRKFNAYIAIGIAKTDGRDLFNKGILFNPNGEIILEAAKSNLWHFDSKWFKSGSSCNVVSTDIGIIGLIVCADGRAPEISRILAVKGADIIIDMANLTASAKDPNLLTNPQVDYMLPTRALENKVWLVMSDKVGIEANGIVYSGKSCIINPDGDIVSIASTSEEEIIYGEIDININKAQMAKRNPKAYRVLAEPTESLPVFRDMASPLTVWDTEVQTAVIQFQYSALKESLKKSKHFIKVFEDQDANFILLPQLTEDADLFDEIEKIKKCISKNNTIVVATGFRSQSNGKHKTSIAFSKEKVYGQYDKVHIDNSNESINPGMGAYEAIKTPYGKIGIIIDQEGLIPEASRALMLNGADIIFWSDNGRRDKNDLVARTRAAENKVYLVRGGGKEREDYSFIVNPNGNIVAASFKGLDQGVSTMIVTAFSKSKSVVPGTNVVLNRQPICYKELVE